MQECGLLLFEAWLYKNAAYCMMSGLRKLGLI